VFQLGNSSEVFYISETHEGHVGERKQRYFLHCQHIPSWQSTSINSCLRQNKNNARSIICSMSKGWSQESPLTKWRFEQRFHHATFEWTHLDL